MAKTMKVYSYKEVVEQVKKIPREERIPVSFIQLEAPGYRSPDPAQMELACLTGGTYQWIAKGDKTVMEFAAGVHEAVRNVRETVRGVWQMDLKFAKPESSWVNGMIVSIDGTLQVKDEDGVVVATQKLSAGQGEELTGMASPRQVLMRTTCQKEQDCPGGSDTDCVVSCVPEGKACAVRGSEPWVESPECCNGVPCTENTKAAE